MEQKGIETKDILEMLSERKLAILSLSVISEQNHEKRRNHYLDLQKKKDISLKMLLMKLNHDEVKVTILAQI